MASRSGASGGTPGGNWGATGGAGSAAAGAIAATEEGAVVTSPCELPQAQSASMDAIAAIRPENPVAPVMLPPDAACHLIAQRLRRATIPRCALTHVRARPIEARHGRLG